VASFIVDFVLLYVVVLFVVIIVSGLSLQFISNYTPKDFLDDLDIVVIISLIIAIGFEAGSLIHKK
jgi:uncharacterized membrane protein